MKESTGSGGMERASTCGALDSRPSKCSRGYSAAALPPSRPMSAASAYTDLPDSLRGLCGTRYSGHLWTGKWRLIVQGHSPSLFLVAGWVLTHGARGEVRAFRSSLSLEWVEGTMHSCSALAGSLPELHVVWHLRPSCPGQGLPWGMCGLSQPGGGRQRLCRILGQQAGALAWISSSAVLTGTTFLASLSLGFCYRATLRGVVSFCKADTPV